MDIFNQKFIFKLNSDQKSLSIVKCTDINAITIDIPAYNDNLPITEICSKTFSDCKYVESINLPNTILQIGESAFEDCYTLEKIKIPNSIIKIGAHAFSGCQNLYDFDISNSVQIIEEYAFAHCSSIYYLNIPASVQNIGDCAFFHCEELKSVNIPSSVKQIGAAPFMHCTKLENITVDKDNIYYTTIDNNLYSKDKKRIIQYCIGKKNPSFSIPNEVVEIGASCFYQSNYLKEIIVSEAVISIEPRAFMHCQKLKKIVFEKPTNWYVSNLPYEPISNDCTNAIDLQSEVDNVDLLKNQFFMKYLIKRI